ncbi:uncharacterized protein LOC143462849 isoform X2 [Clavelina lepadiformis]|uniref:uncharacterized protein LOC143462849 isoform X2 n=1 Tax=Clavelina lepadiformis TaxID=159417 RepID=UPI0040414F8C
MAHGNNFHIVNDVKPTGNILNDSDTGVDYLGNYIYAEALAKRIKHVSTPITIGIFARWGSGKSFLMKFVKGLLVNDQLQSESHTIIRGRHSNWHFRCCLQTILLIFFIFLIVICAIFAGSPQYFGRHLGFLVEKGIAKDEAAITSSTITDTLPNETVTISASKNSLSDTWINYVRYTCLTILLLSLLLFCIMVCSSSDWWSDKTFESLKLLMFVAFTKLPISNIESSICKGLDEDVSLHLNKNLKTTEKGFYFSTRYIFVNFNAWECAGCDTLWAGIITNLIDAVEAEFGSIPTRLIRMLTVEAVPINKFNAKEQPTVVFVKLTSMSREDVISIMLDYGVVCSCEEYVTWKRNSAKKEKRARVLHTKSENRFKQWWVVHYSSSSSAYNAKEDLNLKRIEVLYHDPAYLIEKRQNIDSFKHVVDSNKDEYTERKKSKLNLEISDQERLISNKKCFDESSQQEKEDVSFFKHFAKYPKTTCKFPVLFWWILIFFSGLTIPFLTYSVAESLQLDVFRTPRTVPVAVQIAAWMPATLAASFVIIKFFWAMMHSQHTRINRALKGTKENLAAELGFMNKVKTEVMFISKLIKCVEFCYKKRYKVIITIDDLDRVPLDKVKSVLEAVNILLSDGSSPFVCLIAVDSRIVVKCIDQSYGSTLPKANVSGHEYLKKLINLPFCLPELDNEKKKKFVNGLIDDADETRKRILFKRDNHKWSNAFDDTQKNSHETAKIGTANNLEISESDQSDSNKSISSNMMLPTLVAVCDEEGFYPDVNLNVQIKQPHIKSADVLKNVSKDFPDGHLESHKQADEVPNVVGSRDLMQSQLRIILLEEEKFLFECRHFFYINKMVCKYLEANPRNIKRIFNILSFTASIMNSSEKQKMKNSLLRLNTSQADHAGQPVMLESDLKDDLCKQLARDFVLWVILTDQWPFRISYLLQVIEDTDQRFIHERCEQIADDAPLLDIYKCYVLEELKAIEGDEKDSLLALDCDPEILYSFLKELKEKEMLNKLSMTQLQKYTINLDHSLRSSIVRFRCTEDVDSKVKKIDHVSGFETEFSKENYEKGKCVVVSSNKLQSNIRDRTRKTFVNYTHTQV